MYWFIAGAALGWAVSVPPGANTMLCVLLGREGVRRALPLVAAAAAADSTYALLAGAGALTALLIGAANVLDVATVGFLLLCAYLLWPRGAPPSGRTAIMVAAFNPPAALLWLAFAGSLNKAPSGPVDIIVFAAGAAFATATWFLLVAFASRKLSTVLSDQLLRKTSIAFSIALVGLALLRALTLLPF